MGVKVKIDGVGVVEFDDKFKTLSKQEQQDLVNQIASSRRGTRAATSGSADSGTDAMDYARAAMQGVMFGFSDEGYGLFRGIYDAAVEGKPFKEAYTQARDEVRKNLDDFREDDPLAAYGTEIIASLPMALLGGAGLAKAGISAGKVRDLVPLWGVALLKALHMALERARVTPPIKSNRPWLAALLAQH